MIQIAMAPPLKKRKTAPSCSSNTELDGDWDQEESKCREEKAGPSSTGPGQAKPPPVASIHQRNDTGNDEEERKRRLEAKREYNRLHAAKSAQRAKERVSSLSAKVDLVCSRNAELEEIQKVLSARKQALTTENQRLGRGAY